MMGYYYTDGLFWFRLFGVGFLVKNTKKHTLLFSERNKLVNMLIFGNYAIRFLNKGKKWK